MITPDMSIHLSGWTFMFWAFVIAVIIALVVSIYDN